MAPEQRLGKDLDGRTDIYALACIRHEVVTGIMPFRAHSVEEFRSLQRYDEALESFTRTLQLAPTYGEAHLHISSILAAHGMMQEARVQLERAAQLGNPQALLLLQVSEQ